MRASLFPRLLALRPLAVCSVLVCLVLVGCQKKDTAAPQQPPRVTVEQPQEINVIDWGEYVGRFQARQRVELRSRVSGFLTEIRFKDGQHVEKGDVLFVIDRRPFRLALDKAEARFSLAKQEFERFSKLRQSGVAAEQEFDRRQRELRDARADLGVAQLDFEFSEIRAPLSGTIGRTMVDLGNLVTGGDVNTTLLATLVSDGALDFYFEMSERDVLAYRRMLANDVMRQTPVAVQVAGDQGFPHGGTLDFADNELAQQTGTLQLRATIANEKGLLVSGAFGRLRMPLSAPYAALVIPDEAIATRQAQKYVFVVGENGTVEMRQIEPGALQDDGRTRVVRSGLAATDKIIIRGTGMLRPGMTVTAVENEKTPAPSAEAP